MFAPASSALPGVGQSVELRCVRCLYLLEGHSAEPSTCPECGYANSLSDLRELSGLLPGELRGFESIPTLCVLLFFGIGVGTWLVQSVSPVGGLILLITCLGAWIALVIAFRTLCRGRVGWGRVLGRYHLAAVLIVSVLAGIGWGAAVCGSRFSGRVSFFAYAVLVAAALSGIGKKWGGKVFLTPYHWAKGELDDVCRVVAFERLRERRDRM